MSNFSKISSVTENLLRLATKMATTSRSRPLRVSIEGNIGSGKSSCLQYFTSIEHVEIHPEPIDQWRDVSGNNMLALLYSNLNTWNFTFQHYVYLSRLRLQTSPPLSDKIKVKMFERSLQNSHYCFTETAFCNNHLTEPEYKILTRWYEWAASHLDIDIDLIVYLKTSPEVVSERIMKRNRKEEAEIPLEYLKQVHESYERWLNNPEQVPCEVLTIEADEDLESVLRQLQKYSHKILNISRDHNAANDNALMNVNIWAKEEKKIL